MAWTAPRTWTDDEIVTDTWMNQQIRDNFTLLKTSRDDGGRILGLTAACFDSLSPTNITPTIALETAANAFLAKNNFRSSTLVLPVGSGKSSGNGSVWIDATTLKYINDAAVTKTYTGTLVGASAGVIGSCWIEGNDLHYIDASGNERICYGTSAAMHSDAAAIGGSVWMETVMHWIIANGTTEILGHYDTHADAGHGDSGSTTHGDYHADDHNDQVHHDSPHTDSHGDFPYQDGHGDAN